APPRHSCPKLTPRQVSNIIRQNDVTAEPDSRCAVKYFEYNQLAANHPIEDRRAEAKCLKTPGMLFGIFDGHGGTACAQAVSERLFEYVAVSLLPQDVLEDCSRAMKSDALPFDLLEWYRNDADYTNIELAGVYRRSLERYIDETLSAMDVDEFDMAAALEMAALRLDADIGHEVLSSGGGGERMHVNLESLEAAFSGCTACVAHVDGPHLHVANVGDSRAVVGYLDDNDAWAAAAMSRDHCAENADEVARVRAEHAVEERHTVIKSERLLGELIPLRAFGDFRYKWSKATLQSMLADTRQSRLLIPQHYASPPYLTARPEVAYRRLTARDKFLVMATDGLWEQLDSEKVVRLVAEHVSGAQTLDPYVTHKEPITFGEVNGGLLARKTGLANRAVDTNVASHLIRNALGLTDRGVDHGKLSMMLSLPAEVTRNFRDDITVTVIYFDGDYLAHN
ncbi:PREDICTED: pyruvate dehydrogenase [acetyl-transferring]-phosphatase 1, mitochondrial-like, partial [Priapulus caudatus]|uniref:Pyruvate dehydrogenase [acetyl-transferring]-phosphatase 1, mitochondrial-like n=1 Tax=Priapulus caudatus TaxID=37621 RepID=A0ABM1EIK9_PRICU